MLGRMELTYLVDTLYEEMTTLDHACDQELVELSINDKHIQ